MSFDTSHKWDSRGYLHCPVAMKATLAKPKSNGTYVCKCCSRTLKLEHPPKVARCMEVKP